MAEIKINTEVNQFPSLTYNHLNINKTRLETIVTGEAEPLETALPDGISVKREQSGDGEHIETGLGKAFDSRYDEALSAVGILPRVFTAEKNKKVAVPVHLKYEAKDNASLIADNLIVAEEGSDSVFIFECSGSTKSDSALGCRIKVVAAENARVHVVLVNLTGSSVLFFSSIGSSLSDNAQLTVTELELGGKKTYSGDYACLQGHAAAFTGQLGYIVRDDHFLDVNYVARQLGRDTDSRMMVDGVVADKATKTWRGTIDFVKGAAESKGDEQENVLLLSPEVVNKSLPVILCDEEAVDGRHGASVGRLGSDILFYMQSRGISEKDARKLMVSAKIASVCRFIPDEELVQRIKSFVEEAMA